MLQQTQQAPTTNTQSQALPNPVVPTEGALKDDGKSPSPLSDKMAMLIRREQKNRQERQEIENARKALDTDRTEIEQIKQLRTNPKKLLEFLKLNPAELAESLVSEEGSLPVSAELRALKEELDGFKKQTLTEKQKEAEFKKAQEDAQNQKVLDSHKNAIKEFIKTTNESEKEGEHNRYGYIAFENKYDEVFNKISEHYEKTRQEKAQLLEAEGESPDTAQGELLSEKEAADLVEKELEDKFKGLLENKKFQDMLGIDPRFKSVWQIMSTPMKKEAVKMDLKARQEPPRTLTNKLTETNRPNNLNRTDSERIRDAIAWYKSQRAQ